MTPGRRPHSELRPHVVWGAFWIAVYLGLVLAPLFALLVDPPPTSAGFWWDLAIALGFAGATMMGVQFMLTARFKRAMAPFGIDIIYYFHRYIAVVAWGIIHYFICGPEGMTHAVERALYGLGVPLGRLHTELFDLV